MNKNKHGNNYSVLTEEENQDNYLQYHDELPWNLEVTCNVKKEEYIPLKVEKKFPRPENTSPCLKKFNIKEEEIFINSNENILRYYQICPNCGYIVNIPNELLSEAIKQRIEERCQKDEKLFRKMYLYSELFSLDKKSTNNQKKILKKV